jgi:hypothetical protein
MLYSLGVERLGRNAARWQAVVRSAGAGILHRWQRRSWRTPDPLCGGPCRTLETGGDRRVAEVLVRDELGLREPPLGELRKGGRPWRKTHLGALEVDLLGEQVRPLADHWLASLEMRGRPGEGDRHTWRLGMRVFVTGASGWIGSALVGHDMGGAQPHVIGQALALDALDGLRGKSGALWGGNAAPVRTPQAPHVIVAPARRLGGTVSCAGQRGGSL